MSERPMIIPMTTTAQCQQRYDHRLRDLVQRTRDVTIATDLGVLRSKARGWLDKALDGTRSYLHAVIDNFSRRILAWRVADTFAPVNSVAVLVEASRGATLSNTPPVVWRTRASRT